VKGKIGGSNASSIELISLENLMDDDQVN